MQKIYAIKFSDGTSWLGNSWSECEALIKGKTKLKYKSFLKEEDANAWITGVKIVKKGFRVYVDGSYMPISDYAGWSWVAVKDGVEVARASGRTPHPAASRNIDGELHAAWKAIEYLAEIKQHGIICHDYQGVERWATGKWKANSAVAQIYVARIADIKSWATFERVTGHSGDEWNDLADKIAKDMLIIYEKSKKDSGHK